MSLSTSRVAIAALTSRRVISSSRITFPGRRLSLVKNANVSTGPRIESSPTNQATSTPPTNHVSSDGSSAHGPRHYSRRNPVSRKHSKSDAAPNQNKPKKSFQPNPRDYASFFVAGMIFWALLLNTGSRY